MCITLEDFMIFFQCIFLTFLLHILTFKICWKKKKVECEYTIGVMGVTRKCNGITLSIF